MSDVAIKEKLDKTQINNTRKAKQRDCIEAFYDMLRGASDDLLDKKHLERDCQRWSDRDNPDALFKKPDWFIVSFKKLDRALKVNYAETKAGIYEIKVSISELFLDVKSVDKVVNLLAKQLHMMFTAHAKVYKKSYTDTLEDWGYNKALDDGNSDWFKLGIWYIYKCSACGDVAETNKIINPDKYKCKECGVTKQYIFDHWKVDKKPVMPPFEFLQERADAAREHDTDAAAKHIEKLIAELKNGRKPLSEKDYKMLNKIGERVKLAKKGNTFFA